MKQTIKTMTIALAGIVMALGLTITSCKKAEKGETGPVGATGPQGQAGPQAKTFNFNLTFSSGDTFQSYSGITGVDADDILMFYVKYQTLSSDYYAPLPVIVGTVNFVPEFSEATGNVFMNTLKANGTAGSPWASSVTLGFKAVLIKSAQRLANPNINYNNYSEVKKAFNLKD